MNLANINSTYLHSKIRRILCCIICVWITNNFRDKNKVFKIKLIKFKVVNVKQHSHIFEKVVCIIMYCKVKYYCILPDNYICALKFNLFHLTNRAATM